jgi:hypothetical protein
LVRANSEENSGVDIGWYAVVVAVKNSWMETVCVEDLRKAVVA